MCFKELRSTLIAKEIHSRFPLQGSACFPDNECGAVFPAGRGTNFPPLYSLHTKSWRQRKIGLEVRRKSEAISNGGKEIECWKRRSRNTCCLALGVEAAADDLAARVKVKRWPPPAALIPTTQPAHQLHGHSDQLTPLLFLDFLLWTFSVNILNYILHTYH